MAIKNIGKNIGIHVKVVKNHGKHKQHKKHKKLALFLIAYESTKNPITACHANFPPVPVFPGAQCAQKTEQLNNCDAMENRKNESDI